MGVGDQPGTGHLLTMLKVEYINPVVKNIFRFFRDLLKVSIHRGSITALRAGENGMDLRGVAVLMDVSGGMRGSMVLVFPADTALALVSKLLDKEVKIIDDEAIDAIRDVAIFVEEGARKELEALEPPAVLKISKVVRGEVSSASSASQGMWLEIPFESDLGPFALRIKGAS